MCKGRAWLSIWLLVLVGCQDTSSDLAPGSSQLPGQVVEQADASAAESMKDPAPRVEDRAGLIRVPSQYGFPGVSEIPEAPSFEHALDRLQGDESAYLWSIYFRYELLLWFGSGEAQRKAVHHGMPMPEEWLAARRMSDQELERLADAGNYKARLFQADREFVKWSALQDNVPGEERPHFSQEALPHMVAALGAARRAVRESRTPFALYLLGRIESAKSNSMEPMMAALVIGDRLWGEPGARAAIQRIDRREIRPRLGLLALEERSYLQLLGVPVAPR